MYAGGYRMKGCGFWRERRARNLTRWPPESSYRLAANDIETKVKRHLLINVALTGQVPNGGPATVKTLLGLVEQEKVNCTPLSPACNTFHDAGVPNAKRRFVHVPQLRTSFARDLARTCCDPLPSLQQDQNKVPRLSGSDRALRFSHRLNNAGS
jgi:hypothetical protein